MECLIHHCLNLLWGGGEAKRAELEICSILEIWNIHLVNPRVMKMAYWACLVRDSVPG